MVAVVQQPQAKGAVAVAVVARMSTEGRTMSFAFGTAGILDIYRIALRSPGHLSFVVVSP